MHDGLQPLLELEVPPEEELDEDELPELEEGPQVRVVDATWLSLFELFGSGIPDMAEAIFCTTLLQESTNGVKNSRE